MELVVIATALSLCLSMFLLPSAAAAATAQSSSLENAREEIESRFPLSTLPRKLRLLQDVAVEEHGAKALTSFNKQKPDVSGKPYYHERQNKVHASRAAGTRHEWVEGTDTSQFFTMDYSHVRRRRPIHNKALPVGP